MANVQIKIESASITSQVVAPVWDGKVSYVRARDSVYYRKKFAGDFTFRGADYALIEAIDDCEEITLTAYHYCPSDFEDWILVHTGVFTKMDCKFDRLQCKLSVTPKGVDEYTCLFESWEEEQSVYDAGFEMVVTAVFGEYEAGLCDCLQCEDDPYAFPPTEYPCYGADYCLDEILISNEIGGGACPPDKWAVYSCYHRVVGTGTLTDPPQYGSGWSHISGTDWWRCPTADDLLVGTFNHGRRFSDVLEYIVAQTTCTLTVRSYFFNINATHSGPPTNDAYDYAVEYLQKMTVHQKSDIKRQYGSNPSLAWVWTMKLKDLLDDLRTMFNVYYKIDGSDLIIEHISYFEATAGLDVTAYDHSQEYESSEDVTQKERFFWSDQTANYPEAFAGYPIIYDCGDGETERRVNLFTTDIFTVKASANAEDIADRGFVLISNSEEVSLGAGKYLYFIANFNIPLGWRDLHNNLHRHNRMFETGSISNMTGQTFLSTIRSRRIKSFSITLCCTDTFEPEQYVTTNLGEATIQTAIRNLYTEKLTLNLLI